ncbi:MAG: MFS transporter [Thermoleophilia bacterium]
MADRAGHLRRDLGADRGDAGHHGPAGAPGIQGIGAAILASTATALISAVFPPGERGRAIGINVTAIYLGLALGPIVGGALVAGFGWRWVFLVNIPVSLIALAIARPLEERRRVGTAPMRIDLPGVALLAVGLTAGLVPLTFGPVGGGRPQGCSSWRRWPW